MYKSERDRELILRITAMQDEFKAKAKATANMGDRDEYNFVASIIGDIACIVDDHLTEPTA